MRPSADDDDQIRRIARPSQHMVDGRFGVEVRQSSIERARDGGPERCLGKSIHRVEKSQNGGVVGLG